MTNDVKALTDELSRDPDSLVFLQLGEVLRAQGHIAAAKKIGETGLQRHPRLLEAYDLYARILVSGEELDEARLVWESALELDSRNLAVHKGLGFLFYSQGDIGAALDHIELALAADPTNESVIQAMRAVRSAAEALDQVVTPPEAPAAGASPETAADQPQELFAGFESDHGILLVDTQGRALAGGLQTPEGRGSSEEAAAHLAGVSQEMERTVRMLKMGGWEWLVVEATEGNVHMTQPAADTLLFIVRGQDVPAGRLGLLAESAGARAKSWLEGQRT